MNFLVIGPVVCDIAMKNIDPEDFKRGRTVLERFEIAGGGDANNASIDLARLGEDVRIVSRVGGDFLGQMLTTLLSQNGVDTRYVARDEHAETTAAILMLGPDGVTTISARHSGACDSVRESDVTDEALIWADHLHVVNVMNMPCLDGEGLGRLFARAHEAGVTTSMDLKRPRTPLEKPLEAVVPALSHCDVFLPSDYEV